MQKPHDVRLAEMDWAIGFITEQRAAAAARGEDMTQWEELPETLKEFRDYADEAVMALTDPGD
ncbi:hypothetical protein JDBV08_00690 [Mycobacterium phage jiawei]|uniref:hypothetical protein n=1 Tax=Brevundimonas diminuta TaxID=293 RepID=UPI001905A8E7|nr:hypothetical protein [Brevundimonas diminuta]MBK1968383.1 hypothetical protein [Brevundimonas diminuta]WRQ08305.1 hypothetical protein JDBV08_00690 [Mycobacterium phage jiawei]